MFSDECYEWMEMIISDSLAKVDAAEKLAREILTLNPTSGELGEGKARRLIELAEEVLGND